MKVSFEGFDEKLLSFKSDSTTAAVAGACAKMASSGTVTVCSAGDDLIGVATAVENGFATVQLTGYVKLKYSSTAPTVGYGILVADASGGVKTALSGKTYLVLDVDTTAKTVGFIL